VYIEVTEKLTKSRHQVVRKVKKSFVMKLEKVSKLFVNKVSKLCKGGDRWIWLSPNLDSTTSPSPPLLLPTPPTASALTQHHIIRYLHSFLSYFSLFYAAWNILVDVEADFLLLPPPQSMLLPSVSIYSTSEGYKLILCSFFTHQKVSNMFFSCFNMNHDADFFPMFHSS
jgi:hypothetical protein